MITPPSPGSIGEVVTETPSRLSPQPNRKRRKDSQASVLTQSLAECDAMMKKSMEDDNDEDALYCRRLIPIMRELPKKQKRLAKIEISQLLYDIQYGDE